MTILRLRGRYFKYLPREEMGYEFEEFEVDVNEAAFVAVDLYASLGYSPKDAPAPELNVLVSGKKKEPHRDIVLNRIVPAIDAARRAGLPIVYVNNSAPRIRLESSEFERRRVRFSGWRSEDVFAEDCVDPREYAFGHSTHIKLSKVVEP